jgi:hypothetical protein
LLISAVDTLKLIGLSILRGTSERSESVLAI